VWDALVHGGCLRCVVATKRRATQEEEDVSMKLAITSSTVGDGTIEGAIAYCKDLDVDRLVVPFGHVPGFQEKGYLELDQMRSLKKKIEDGGLSFSTMMTRPDLKMITGGPGAGKLWEDFARSLETMGEVGADVLTIFITRDRPEDPSEVEAAWERLVDFYQTFMAQAETCGVRIALHPAARTAKRRRRDLVHDYATVRRLMDDAPSSSNGVCLCVGNFWLSAGDEMYDVIRKLGDKVFNVHVRSTKKGLGETPFWFDVGGPDYAKVVQALKDIEYDGELVPEHLPEVAGQNRAETATAWVVGYMKALMQYE
jgi:sugar phosphate isomerase/epimerase